jgi:DNA-binding transcriptional LysR family regulator
MNKVRDLNDLLFFTAVVEHNGFSAAARAMNVPKSSVSRHVGRLEDRLGVRLLERSTRNVRLTDVGGSYYQRCKAVLIELDAADRNLAQLQSDPAGIIRVSCPTGMAQDTLARIVPGFMSRYPLVRLQLVATNRRIDLVDDNIDVAIRVRAQLADESITMRRLGSNRMIFAASPAFVSRHEMPSEPADLVDFPFLSFQEETARPTWTLLGPRGAKQTLTLEPALWTSDFTVLIQAACAGVGVTLLPVETLAKRISEGSVVRVLPQWHSDDVTVHLVFTTKRGLAPAVRAFIDYLVDQYALIEAETLAL